MRALSVALLVLLSACAGQYAGTGWDGRRGYDGRGDYGYDVDASRAEAQAYRTRASRSYPVPGTPDDPWGPYVREAASRYAVPERWIREVMRQESGGRLWSADCALTTSPVGAMGLMQVMPATYDVLRRRYGLGEDAYEPHDNIMAGAVYIREMYDRFGSPTFLAAYNAGPDRVDAYLAGTADLPGETASYLAQVAPRLGGEVAMTGPLAAYAGSGAPATPGSAADRAFDGGGLVTPWAPTGDRTVVGTAGGDATETAAAGPPSPGVPEQDLSDDAATVPAAPADVADAGRARSAALGSFQPAVLTISAQAPLVAAPTPRPGAWAIQVGAFPDPATSRAAMAAARSRVGRLLSGSQPVIAAVPHGSGTLYRARLLGLSADGAGAACAALSRAGVACFTVPPGS